VRILQILIIIPKFPDHTNTFWQLQMLVEAKVFKGEGQWQKGKREKGEKWGA
jgi:hypothetical protein